MAGSALDTHWSGSHLVTQVNPVWNPVTDLRRVGKPPDCGHDYGETFPGEGKGGKGGSHMLQSATCCCEKRERETRTRTMLGKDWGYNHQGVASS